MLDLLRSVKAFEESAVLYAVLNLARTKMAEPLYLDDLAEVSGMTDGGLTRFFNRKVKMTPMRWLWQLRLAAATEIILSNPYLSVTHVAQRCGFANSSHFSRRFMALMQVSPVAFRQNVRDRGHSAETLVTLSQIRHVLSRLGAIAAAPPRPIDSPYDLS